MSVADEPRPSERTDGAAIKANHCIANNLALTVGLIRFQARKPPREPFRRRKRFAVYYRIYPCELMPFAGCIGFPHVATKNT